MKRVLITGSRDWASADMWVVSQALADECWDTNDMTVIQGGARGADYFAARWVMNMRDLALDVREHPEQYEGQHIPHVVGEEVAADWHRFGRAAGHIRNQTMVDSGADVCLAFPIAGSRGTLDCMRRADEAGIPIKVYGKDGHWSGYRDWKNSGVSH